MPSIPIRTSAPGRLRLLAGAALAALTFAALAVLPTEPAQASTPTVTVPSPSELEAALGKTPLQTLNRQQLAEDLSHLPAFEGLEAAKLEEALGKTIEALLGKGANLEELLKGGEGATILREKLKEVLGLLEPQLETLLGGNPRSKLAEALQSSGAKELLGKLLSGSPEPQALIGQILAALGPERLQSLLGSALAGEPFSKTTVERLAQQLGTTSQALAEKFGASAGELPAAAMALTAPLRNGEKIGVLNGVGGMTLGVIKGAGEAVGGAGGTGGTGSPSPGAGTTTVTIASSSPAPSGAGNAAAVKVGKLRVISHRVRGQHATVVVEVPAAGSLAAAGRGLHSIRRETSRAERVTLQASLTRAGSSSLRRHHRRLKVPFKVAFQPVGGGSSSVTVPLLFR
jgi:hypothetical protein